MAAYRKLAIETYLSIGESSSKSVRARPLAGQGLSVDMHVECSSKMRLKHPIGTVFIIRAKITNREGGPDFVYTSWQWPYVVSDKSSARDLIEKMALS
jgi:predicted transcriptional regulator